MVPASLFDRPAVSPLGSASGWAEMTLQNEAAVSLCVIAVAILGYTMLTGRLPIRRAAMVVLGCFVLLGAPMIAGEIVDRPRPIEAGPSPQAAGVLYERAELPPAEYDLYAGASLIRP